MVKRLLVLSAIASLAAASPVFAYDYPKQVYDAMYAMTGPQGNSVMRMASDGAGKLLTATKMRGAAVTSIIDYQNNTTTTLMEQAKMAMVNKLPPSSKFVGDDDTIKKSGGKPIGTKTIAGHPCHGWEYSEGGVKTQCWIGDDIKVMVQSITNSPQGKTVMTLQSFEKKAPPANLMKIPPGYKMMNMGG